MALFSPRHSALSCRTLFWAWPPRVDPHQEHKVRGYALSRLGQEKSIKGPTGSAYLSSILFLFIFSFRCFFADKKIIIDIPPVHQIHYPPPPFPSFRINPLPLCPSVTSLPAWSLSHLSRSSLREVTPGGFRMPARLSSPTSSPLTRGRARYAGRLRFGQSTDNRPSSLIRSFSLLESTALGGTRCVEGV